LINLGIFWELHMLWNAERTMIGICSVSNHLQHLMDLYNRSRFVRDERTLYKNSVRELEPSSSIVATTLYSKLTPHIVDRAIVDGPLGWFYITHKS